MAAVRREVPTEGGARCFGTEVPPETVWSDQDTLPHTHFTYVLGEPQTRKKQRAEAGAGEG